MPFLVSHAEANLMRSQAAKEQPRSEDGKRMAEKQVVVHCELPPDREVALQKEDRNKGRAARAKEANVSTATQARVEALANNRPDLLERLAKGEIKGTEALRQMKKDQVAERVQQLPDDTFTVIYADPPWACNDKQGGSISESYGAAEKHYPSMSLSELKALDIPKLAAPDSVLWLWATCPLLEDALALAAAWGFKYKAQFVWDKVKHNMGHYNSVRHELLLVCTKGSCTPQVVNSSTPFSPLSAASTARSQRNSETSSIPSTQTATASNSLPADQPKAGKPGGMNYERAMPSARREHRRKTNFLSPARRSNNGARRDRCEMKLAMSIGEKRFNLCT